MNEAGARYLAVEYETPMFDLIDLKRMLEVLELEGGLKEETM